MVLTWTTEEIVLLNIGKAIVAGWRMNGRQLCEYHKKLLRNQSKILPGQLGSVFLELLGEISTAQKDIRWSDLLNDVDCLQRLLQEHWQWSSDTWLKFLPWLEKYQSRYFKTELGRAFVQVLKCKLVAKRRRSNSQAKRIRTNLQDKEELERIAAWLSSDADGDDGDIKLEQIAAWLLSDADGNDGDIKEKRKKRIFFSKSLEKAVVPLLACLTVCFMGIWLRGEMLRRQSEWKVQQMKTEAAQKAAAIVRENSEPGMETEAKTEIKVKSADDLGKPAQAPLSSGRGRQEDLQQERLPAILPQYAEMAAQYPELFGWLKIPETEIDMPVMKPEDDREYYLHHDFTGAQSLEGALFADQDSSSYPQDNNLVIYGHNMKNGHMFGTLKLYTDKDFFNAHKKICFDTIYETGVYEAVAVLKTRILNENEEGFRYYQFFNYTNQKEFQECLKFVEKNQIFETGSMIQYGDHILMLSTCEYSQENGRLVVVARMCEN